MMGTLKLVNLSEMIFSKNVRKKPNLHSKEASDRLGYTYYLFIDFLSFHFIFFPFSSSTSKLQAKTNQTRSVLITLKFILNPSAEKLKEKKITGGDATLLQSNKKFLQLTLNKSVTIRR